MSTAPQTLPTSRSLNVPSMTEAPQTLPMNEALYAPSMIVIAQKESRSQEVGYCSLRDPSVIEEFPSL